MNSEQVLAMLKTNVNEHTEKKNGLTYLSWAWAWAEALKADPEAIYKIEMFGDKCFMDINGTAMVFVTVTLFGKPMTCQLPVMDYRNKAIPNPDAFAVNTAIMRCMTKALSLHGLGLYIYAGEDIPDEEEVDLTGQADIWVKAINTAKDIDELKTIYGNAYHQLSKDKSAVAKISAAKDAKKAKLGA